MENMLKDILIELAILLAMIVSLFFFVPFAMHPPFFHPISIPAFLAFIALLFLSGHHAWKLWGYGKTKTTIGFIVILLAVIAVSSMVFWEISKPGLVYFSKTTLKLRMVELSMILFFLENSLFCRES